MTISPSVLLDQGDDLETLLEDDTPNLIEVHLIYSIFAPPRVYTKVAAMKESRLFSEAAASRTVAEEIYTKKEALFYQLFGTRKCALWIPYTSVRKSLLP